MVADPRLVRASGLFRLLRSLNAKLPSNFPAALLAIYAAQIRGERLRTNELHDVMLPTPRSSSHRMLDLLKEMGFVDDDRDPRDRRVVWLFLTEKGHQLVGAMLETFATGADQDATLDNSRHPSIFPRASSVSKHA